MEKLGTISLSSDILKNSQIGLWAFELDDGKAPRMYADDAMLKLLGIEKPLSPEDTYHAWYDHIDDKHYAEVEEAVEKMVSGTKAEVQYPWHHPNGEVWIVRCGGVRNYEYTDGIRIEGVHQNVTEIVHYQRRSLSDMLANLAENFLDIYYLDPYTGQLEAYSNKSSYDGKDNRDFSQINFYDDVAEKSGDIVHPKDKPLIDKMYDKKHLIHLLETNGSEDFIVRWPIDEDGNCLYMRNKLTVYKDFDGKKKIIIGVQDVTKEKEAEQILEDRLIILEALGRDYDYVDIVELYEDKHKDTSRHVKTPPRNDTYVPKWNDENLSFHDRLDMIENFMVYSPDRESFHKQTRRETILKNLEKDRIYYVNFRIIIYDIIHYAQIKFIGITNDEGKIVRFFSAYINADKQMTQQMEIRNKLSKALKDAEVANKYNKELVNNLSGDIKSSIEGIISSNEFALNHISSQEIVNDCLLKNSLDCRRILGILNELFESYNSEKDIVVDEKKSAIELKGKLVLLVDDNELNLEIATDLLEEYGMNVETATNGQQAVNRCVDAFITGKAKKPDVILMDGQMPVMNGYDATRTIRSFNSEDAKKVPIIAMTANAFNEDKGRSFEAGMNAHLSKPINIPEFEKTLKALLQ